MTQSDSLGHKLHDTSPLTPKWHTRKMTLTINSRSRSVTLECPTADSVQERHTTLTLFITSNEAFVSLMPAVLVQDRFVSTVYCGYTIIVSHVLVTLSVFSWIGDEQNLWFVSVTRRRDARDDTHHSFCVVTLDSAGHWTQPLALVRVSNSALKHMNSVVGNIS